MARCATFGCGVLLATALMAARCSVSAAAREKELAFVEGAVEVPPPAHARHARNPGALTGPTGVCCSANEEKFFVYSVDPSLIYPFVAAINGPSAPPSVTKGLVGNTWQGLQLSITQGNTTITQAGGKPLTVTSPNTWGGSDSGFNVVSEYFCLGAGNWTVRQGAFAFNSSTHPEFGNYDANATSYLTLEDRLAVGAPINTVPVSQAIVDFALATLQVDLNNFQNSTSCTSNPSTPGNCFIISPFEIGWAIFPAGLREQALMAASKGPLGMSFIADNKNKAWWTAVGINATTGRVAVGQVDYEQAHVVDPIIPSAAKTEYFWTAVGINATTAGLAAELGNPKEGDMITEAQMVMLKCTGNWNALWNTYGIKKKPAPKLPTYVWTAVGINATTAGGHAAALDNPKEGDVVTEDQMIMLLQSGKWNELVNATGIKKTSAAPNTNTTNPNTNATNNNATNTNTNTSTSSNANTNANNSNSNSNSTTTTNVTTTNTTTPAATTTTKQTTATTVTTTPSSSATESTAPTASAFGPAGKKYVQQTLQSTKVSVVMTPAGVCEAQSPEDIKANTLAFAKQAGADQLVDFANTEAKCSDATALQDTRVRRATKDKFDVNLVSKDTVSADQVFNLVAAVNVQIKQGAFSVEVSVAGKAYTLEVKDVATVGTTTVAVLVAKLPGNSTDVPGKTTTTLPAMNVPKAAASLTGSSAAVTLAVLAFATLAHASAW